MSASGPAPRYTLLLVADDPAFAARVRAQLARCPELEVVGEARDAREALDLLLRLEPDAAIVELQVAVVDGRNAAARWLAAVPRLRLILVGAAPDPEVEPLALEMGAVRLVPEAELTAERITALVAGR